MDKVKVNSKSQTNKDLTCYTKNTIRTELNCYCKKFTNHKQVVDYHRAPWALGQPKEMLNY